MENENKPNTIYDILYNKASLKQDVFEKTTAAFHHLKKVLKSVEGEYRSTYADKDSRVVVEYSEIGGCEARLQFGGDILIFHKHSNIFGFDSSHSVMNSSYVKSDPTRAYCGVINVYNFLSDSFKFNRKRDLGLLVARLFVNKENHFFVEGKKKLNICFRDFMHDQLSVNSLEQIVEQCIRYVLDFELQTPPFQQVEVVTVEQMESLSGKNKLRTVKRLGYRMKWEQENFQ